MTDERLNETPNTASSCPSPAAEKFLPTAGWLSPIQWGFLDNWMRITSQQLTDGSMSIQQLEAETTSDAYARVMGLQRTSTELGQAVTSEGRPSICPNACPEIDINGFCGS